MRKNKIGTNGVIIPLLNDILEPGDFGLSCELIDGARKKPLLLILNFFLEYVKKLMREKEKRGVCCYLLFRIVGRVWVKIDNWVTFIEIGLI